MRSCVCAFDRVQFNQESTYLVSCYPGVASHLLSNPNPNPSVISSSEQSFAFRSSSSSWPENDSIWIEFWSSNFFQQIVYYMEKQRYASYDLTNVYFVVGFQTAGRAATATCEGFLLPTTLLCGQYSCSALWIATMKIFVLVTKLHRLVIRQFSLVIVVQGVDRQRRRERDGSCSCPYFRFSNNFRPRTTTTTTTGHRVNACP